MQPALMVEHIDELSVHERKNLVAALHDLVNTTYNTAEGYHAAARAVKSRELATFFEECASHRRESTLHLRSLLSELGAELGPHPTLAGELHRAWIAFRGSVEGGEATSILSECERGEHVAVGHYERALAQKMPMSIASVLLDQVAQVRAARDAYDRMRHQW